MATLRNDLVAATQGLAMGSANVVPGVSGGTVALIVGIYARLVNAIAAFDMELLALVRRGRLREAAEHVDFRFLFALGVGNVIAIVSLAKLLTWLILNKPVPTWSLFFGLIVASAFLVFRQVGRWTAGTLAAALAGAAFTFWLSGLLPGEASHGFVALFLSGVVAICAAILPGISGSFVLVILGQYLFVLQSIHERRLAALAIFAAGCASGLIAFAKALKYLLRERYALTMAFLCGLMAGSLRKIWPFKVEAPGQELLKLKHRVQLNVMPDSFDEAVAWALAMAALGIVVVLLADLLGRRASEE
ncbi:MAG: DUF368 domain-containing protein [Elusimicrobiota bacterium]